jgi:endonuclease YncB( thermonuclease family)
MTKRYRRNLPMRLVLALWLAGSVSASFAYANGISGKATVVDGDTLGIQGIRVHLFGVDAPESSQLCRRPNDVQYQCGVQAARKLEAFIANRAVTCSPVDGDGGGRTVATCSVNGTDLGDWLVRNGLAFDRPEISEWRYHDAQLEAEHAARGVWNGVAVRPWRYRDCIAQHGKPADCSDEPSSHP